MMIKEIRKALGLSQRKFSERYKIPLRTIENWESGKNSPPEYVYGFLEEKVTNDLIILDIAKKCAKELKVELPEIKFGCDLKNNNPALLVLDSNRNPKEIRITDNYKTIYDIIFAICHELRHVYQAKFMKDIFENYEETGSLDTETYNLQKAEIDANAFAKMYVEDNFELTPLFNSYSETVKKEIEKRKLELKEARAKN